MQEKWYDWSSGTFFTPKIECLVCKREIETFEASQSSGLKDTVQCHYCHVILGKTKEISMIGVPTKYGWKSALFSPNEETCRVFGLDRYIEE